MQLMPLILTEKTVSLQPSKTWKVDFEKKKITGTTDGLDAIKQAVILCLDSERYEHVIYSRDYGIETLGLFGKSFDYTRKELQAEIESALCTDDRIKSADNFNFSKNGDKMTVNFTVACGEGTVSVEGDFDV